MYSLHARVKMKHLTLEKLGWEGTRGKKFWQIGFRSWWSLFYYKYHNVYIHKNTLRKIWFKINLVEWVCAGCHFFMEFIHNGEQENAGESEVNICWHIHLWLINVFDYATNTGLQEKTLILMKTVAPRLNLRHKSTFLHWQTMTTKECLKLF